MLMTDEVGLAPGSARWMAYRTERFDKIIAGDDDVKGCLIQLDVFDAIIKAAHAARSNECR
jgi:hypothetical protein